MRPIRCCNVLLAILLASTSLFASWTRTADTKGNQIFSVGQSAGYLFAGTWGAGIYRSSDNGVTWIPANNGLAVSTIYGFGEAPGWVFACTESGAGVYRSSDNGATWQLAATGLSSSLTVYGMAVVQDSGRSNLFITAYNAVYRSTNNGTSWTPSRTGATAVRAIGAQGTIVFTGGTEGVYRTTNLGATWTRADSGMTNKYASAFTVSVSTIFATIFNGGIYKSTNGGVFWTPAGLGNRNLWGVASTDSAVYAGEYVGGVHRTTDGGSTWTPLGPSGVTVRSLLAIGSRVFAGAYAGLYPSTDKGTTWQPVLLSSPRTLSIAGTSKLYAGGWGGVSTTTDQGTTWTFSGISDWRITSVDVRGAVALAAAGGGGVFLSTNDGATWTERNNGLAGKTPMSVLITDGGAGTIKLHTGTLTSGICASSDTGKTWTVTSAIFYQVTGFASLGTVLLAGTVGEGIYRSTDNGASWSHPGVSNAQILSVVTNGNRIFAGSNGSGVLVSTDTGRTLTASGLAGATVRALASTGTKVFAGGSTGIWLTMNNGASWTAMNTGLTDTSVYSLWISGSDLYASVGSGGVWKRPLSELVVGVDESWQRIPVTFGLSQNFPNPFNPSTSISVELPVAGNVRMVVFDLLGREVATLLNGRKEAGVHEVVFDASGLPSGVYLYRAESGSSRQTRKMILMR